MTWARMAAGLLIGVVLAAQASGYYHFLHVSRGITGLQAIPERFDLDALPDETVYFYLSSERPKLPANDTYEGFVSQVRQALGVWDSVATSRLRVAYGGLTDGALPGETSAGEIVFAELPPGVVGLGGPVVRAQARKGFVPIVRSRVILSNDLAQGRPRASFSEAFFNSLVHEIGHALGLQHTLASSAMSTGTTRATTRAIPLAADDAAGLSALYPAAELTQIYGAAEGRVTTRSGAPVALASVVALHPGGDVVSALSDSEGRYRIEGLSPGSHLLYAHALPPATQDGLGPANIVLPTFADGATAATPRAFRTVFYPSNDRPGASPRVEVAAGKIASAIDFTVDPTDALSLYNVSTFSFPGNGAPGVHPAFLNLTNEPGFLLAVGPGVSGDRAGLAVEVLGRDLRPRSVGAYRSDARFTRVDFDAAPFAGLGPAHLLFRSSDDVYVLPAGMVLTPQPAPIIHWVMPDFRSPTSWRVGGENLSPTSLAFFDGLEADIVDFDPLFGEIILEPPPGPSGHRAVVTVYNPDGQSSAFTLPDGNAGFVYPAAPSPTVRFEPQSAPAGSDVIVNLVSNRNFAASEAVVGFGSSDIVVRGAAQMSSTQLRIVVSVLPSARAGRYPVSVTSGLEVITADARFGVEPADTEDPRRPVLRVGGLVNAATGKPDLSPGVRAVLTGERLALPDATTDGQVVVRFGSARAELFQVSSERIEMRIPVGASLGGAEMTVFNGQAESALLVKLDRVSPGIFEVLRRGGAALDANRPLVPGETLEIIATGLGVGNLGFSSEAAPRIQVLFGGARLVPSEVLFDDAGVGVSTLRVPTPQVASQVNGSYEVSLLVEGRRSNRVRVPVRSAATVRPVR